MKLFAVATLFAAAAMAMPHAPSSTEVEQTQNTCGNAQLSCCQEFDSSVHVTQEEEGNLLRLLGDGLLNDGLLNNVLGKYRGCSALASLQGTVGGQCNNHVACCNGASTNNVGLVNVAIPCLPVNLL